jgi:peroxiredoxin
MGKKSLLLIAFISVSGLLLFNGCQRDRNKSTYLLKVIRNIEQIRSAEYLSVMIATLPGDTSRVHTYYWLKKEYSNPADTTIGSSLAWFYPDDTSRMYFYYDGTTSAYLDFERKIITVDSFKTNTLAFRPVTPPFFNRAKSIIKYSLETKDTIKKSLDDYGDSIRLKLYVPHKLTHFFGKPFTVNNSSLSKEEAFSGYEVWINKSDDLPYQIKSIMPQSTYWEICKNAVINTKKNEVLRAEDYFPPDFEIRVRGKQQVALKDMTGMKAPDWTLMDSDNNPITLKALKSKIVLIEFTGIGCAPCHAALPFIKQLVTDNKNNDFELVSIETWSNDIESLRRYQKNNDLNYNLLKASDEVIGKYQVKGVPAFYFVDENRVIRKVIFGYEKGETDKEIRDAIAKML